MKIIIGSKEATGNEIFSIIWRGWFIGVTVIFMPISLIAGVAALLSRSQENSFEILAGVVMVPIIAAMQGIIISGIILLGLKLWPPKKSSDTNDS